jgi:hypothetical protein
MELESLEYKTIMENERDTEVLGRLANLHMANIALRHGARSIKRKRRRAERAQVVGA